MAHLDSSITMLFHIFLKQAYNDLYPFKVVCNKSPFFYGNETRYYKCIFFDMYYGCKTIRINSLKSYKVVFYAISNITH